MAKKIKEPTQAQPQEAVRYTKEQLAGAKRYREKKDLIRALLEPGKTYTREEADELLETFRKGTVRAC
jgi:hypothetical protein